MRNINEEKSLAPRLGQSTTGSRLPRWRGALLSWAQGLTMQPPPPSISSPESEIPAFTRSNGVNEANVPAILHEAVLERLRAERDEDCTPAQAQPARTTNGSSFVMSADLRGHSSVLPATNGAAEALLFESRLPRWKRVADLCILGSTVWLWLPLTALVMCVVKVVSPGPVFYRQRRIGFRGKEFMIFKFRSMQVNAETKAHEEYVGQLMEVDAPMTKLDAGDSRLIPCGRLLRATGLDELPQVFNILRGEMSLVGPRPCTVLEFQRYRPEHRARVNAPPGLTGFWQVNGKNRTTFNEMVAMDIFYTENMSLLLDLNIIWKTIPAILRQTRDSSAAIRMRNGKTQPQTVRTTSTFERFPEQS